MRQPDGLRYALLGVVSRNPRGIHGYALRRKCERALGGFWQLNFGEVYRILDRLVGEDLIEQVAGGRAGTRKVYRITDRGRASLDAFILEPPADAPRPLRQELSIKLLFASPGHLDHVLQLVTHQRNAYLSHLHTLSIQRTKLSRLAGDHLVTKLLIDGAELHARAEIAWLDDVAQTLKDKWRRPEA
ncbi:MAG: PadR family transcriptional regulator [Deltaproteobacteria bacterium]|nr:PadR family transcriptional regulator [Deltaproteobacteria bacterium]